MLDEKEPDISKRVEHRIIYLAGFESIFNFKQQVVKST